MTMEHRGERLWGAGRPREGAAGGGGGAIGVGWMSREGFARLAALCDDPRSFNLPYEDWRQLAEAAISGMRAQGLEVVRVELDPERFLAWCRARDLRPDGRARSAYAREAVRGGDA